MSNVQLFIAGDSTAADYPPERAPMAGWGQMIGRFFRSSVVICNEARNGRSSKSFIEEGHLQRIEAGIRAGDYLFVQFGHNDEKEDAERHTDPETTYPAYLSRYLDLAESKGAHPVLLTSLERRHFNEAGELIPTHGAYPDAMRRLAAERGVPLLDMTPLTQQLYVTLGAEKSKSLFVWLEPGEHPNYPEGERDNTHFNETGAEEIARLVVQEIRRAGLPLADHLR